eukprot:CAMPEP_0196143194 /NCGR_PEP_ID=MMETSP0910-20130528/12851_1 /TAXON_ID=49265 /ORGANISM="Thalassiosira rotula, Strain GSO102" /LENGTH=378 /DNA_ID=CAMNT_0041404607 /DNA_START=80 /DNA_END=1216 /DNA_ORIENTATION=+
MCQWTSTRIRNSILVFSFSFCTAVEATYSIVATDAITRQVGGAGATCLPSDDVFNALYLSAPNRSVLHTQGLLLERNGPIVTTTVEMMEGGESIDNILAKMLELDTADFNGFRTDKLRQYGMADFNTNSHGGYTGDSLQSIYDDVLEVKNTEQVDLGVDRKDEGADSMARGRYSYHAQGNVVAEETVTSISDGFLGGEDKGIQYCDMAARLMAAMFSVVQAGLGDMRCINDHGGVSASGAFLHIDNPNGTELIHINIVGDGSFEPVEKMRQEFLVWRDNNPCPVTDDEPPGDQVSMESNVNATAPTKHVIQDSSCNENPCPVGTTDDGTPGDQASTESNDNTTAPTKPAILASSCNGMNVVFAMLLGTSVFIMLFVTN